MYGTLQIDQRVWSIYRAMFTNEYKAVTRIFFGGEGEEGKEPVFLTSLPFLFILPFSPDFPSFFLFSPHFPLPQNGPLNFICLG